MKAVIVNSKNILIHGLVPNATVPTVKILQGKSRLLSTQNTAKRDLKKYVDSTRI